jgi:hypothetical protein
VPVLKFRSLEEGPGPRWMRPDDPRLPGRIRSWWAFSARLWPVCAPRGVRRFHSIEEADTDRRNWPRRER